MLETRASKCQNDGTGYTVLCIILDDSSFLEVSVVMLVISITVKFFCVTTLFFFLSLLHCFLVLLLQVAWCCMGGTYQRMFCTHTPHSAIL